MGAAGGVFEWHGRSWPLRKGEVRLGSGRKGSLYSMSVILFLGGSWGRHGCSTGSSRGGGVI